jgi:hypothetical protein
MTISTEQMLRQRHNHVTNLTNGDKVIHIQGGVYDLFSGIGWDNHIRFRVIKFRDKTKPNQLVQLSTGLTLSREYRETLLKELQ